MRKLIAALALSLALPLPSLHAQQVDLEMVTRIRDEGFNRSQVMETLTHLTEEIGPRLTGSPQMKEANEWTRRKLTEWGLVNARLEPFPFGRGWSFTRASVRMTAPREVQLLGLPKAWTPATEGPIRGPVMRVTIEEEKDLEEYKGKLAGKILLLDEPREVKDEDPEAPFHRHSREDLDGLQDFEIPDAQQGEGFRAGAAKRWKLRHTVSEFMVAEKVAATLEQSTRDHGIVRVAGNGGWEAGSSPGVPGLVLSSEQYNQIVRWIDEEREVEIEVDVAARYYDDDPNAYSTFAEIPGTDKKGEVVMLGAHLDSWHAGTGATDNAAGVAAMMEAVRILKALGVKPRRTIRIALWGGEEQGLLASNAYVREHFADRPETKDEEQLKLPLRVRKDTWPLNLKPAHAKLSAYYNMDNGTGRIRGIYAEENAALVPIFKAWLAPLHDLGADTVSPHRTGATDHVPFDRVGLPGFQFIQDPMEYFSRTHHSNLDTLDHIRRKDLMQASVVIATFVYNTAMRDELLPRKPVPQEPPAKKEKKKEEKKEE